MNGSSSSLASNPAILDKYLSLPQPSDKIQCMYVWIDGTGEHLRAKTRTVSFVPEKPEDLPVWNFDGSSTGKRAPYTRVTAVLSVTKGGRVKRRESCVQSLDHN